MDDGVTDGLLLLVYHINILMMDGQWSNGWMDNRLYYDYVYRSYFSPEGIEYSLARVPVAGTDFSQSFYTYDDFAGDETLLHFNLTEADYYYKVDSPVNS